MNDLFGVKVLVNANLPPDTMVVMGEVRWPPEAKDWTDRERMTYAIAHGAVVVIQNTDMLPEANRERL